jgi:hypothetical protein
MTNHPFWKDGHENVCMMCKAIENEKGSAGKILNRQNSAPKAGYLRIASDTELL